MKLVESPSNPLFKTLRRLARPRKREPLMLLEGRKLVRAAIESGVEIETLLLSTGATDELSAPGAEVVRTSEALLRKASTLETPDGILAVARRPRRRMEELPARGRVVVSVGIQDPGNLGAIARVAEAAGAEALVVAPGSADPFGPKALRGSMGSLLRIPVFETAGPDALRERGFRLAALDPKGGVDFREADFRPPLALLLGSEGRGLSEEWLRSAEVRVTIPMRGSVESLNVAAACALVLYEAARPRDGSEISWVR